MTELERIGGLAATSPEVSPDAYELIQALLDVVKTQGEALKSATIHLTILTGRMRACRLKTGQHELLDEAVMFCDSAAEAQTDIDVMLKEIK